MCFWSDDKASDTRHMSSTRDIKRVRIKTMIINYYNFGLFTDIKLYYKLLLYL